MLKSISSYNFQSHKSTIIDFCDGLNVITGSSDSGKSSVIRAFRWVYENRPSGDSIKNWDSKKEDAVSVGIQLSEGSVCKERISGKVKYLLDSEKGSYEFEAIRSDVPQEIIEFFNLSEYNIQTQHDPYFLLNDSSGEVAKKLNSLVGLDIIDTIFKNLNSKILGLKRSIEESEKTHIFLNEQLKGLSWIDQAEIDLNKLEDIETALKQDNAKFDDIEEIVTRCNSIAEELIKIQPLKILEKSVNKIYDDLLLYKQDQKKCDDILSLIQSIENFKASIKVQKNQLKIEKPCALLKKEVENYLINKQKVKEIKNTLELIYQLQEEQNNIKSILEENQTLLKNLLMKNKICPLCGSSITEKKIQEILR